MEDTKESVFPIHDIGFNAAVAHLADKSARGFRGAEIHPAYLRTGDLSDRDTWRHHYWSGCIREHNHWCDALPSYADAQRSAALRIPLPSDLYIAMTLIPERSACM